MDLRGKDAPYCNDPIIGKVDRIRTGLYYNPRLPEFGLPGE